ncbi:unnamed protein product [Hermetia illucens]|uniref:Gustatory receptor n=1 Tax=Hermetia illucens TaxID=343691 RepID=A0A7R8V0G5_HERIL|nr:unnamed protein product [Hermetia illucens]
MARPKLNLRINYLMVFFLGAIFVYSKILGIFPLTYNRITRRLEFSASGVAYSVVINTLVLISMPFAMWLVFQDPPVRTNAISDLALRTQCLLMYIISMAAFVGRLGMQHRAMHILNQHSDLAAIIEDLYSQKPKRTLLLIMVSLKCILPVNQFSAAYSLVLGDTRSTWKIMAHCVMLFSYGQLFVIIGTWSLRNISFRLMYDNVNNRLSSIFNDLKYQKATRKKQFSFASGIILCNDCKFSAAIDELADFNSAIHLSLELMSSLTPKVHVGVLIFQFINNVFGWYQCYNLLQIAFGTGDFQVVFLASMTTTWNFADIFVLFLTCSLVHEGSISEGWKTLCRQFDTSYSNIHLDRSTDILIGAEFYAELLSVGQIKVGNNLSILQKTLLGWVITGRVATSADLNTKQQSACGIFTKEQSLDEQLSKFWKLKKVNHLPRPLTTAERRCEEHFLPTTIRGNETTELEDSYNMALKRFASLEKKLNKSPGLKAQSRSCQSARTEECPLPSRDTQLRFFPSEWRKYVRNIKAIFLFLRILLYM